MKIIGLDLAWSSKNNSGVALFDATSEKLSLLDVCLLKTDFEIQNYVKKHAVNDSVLIPIDAPLVVPNKTGRRPVEDIVSKMFGKYQASAHSANRNILKEVRGETLGALLEKEGVAHNAYLDKLQETRMYFEVYPHAAMVVMGNLECTLKYKERQGRDMSSRHSAFDKYHKILEKYVDISKIKQNTRDLTGSALKGYEDKLDAIFCGIIAHEYWKNPDKFMVLGYMRDGYIVTPGFSYQTSKKQISLKEFLNQFYD